MALILALVAWCAILTEILVKIRSKRMMKDPANVEVLPFKSRILGGDRVEKKPLSVEQFIRFRSFVYGGFIILIVAGELLVSVAVPNEGQESRVIMVLYSTLGRFIVGTIGGTLGGLIGLSRLSEE